MNDVLHLKMCWVSEKGRVSDLVIVGSPSSGIRFPEMLRQRGTMELMPRFVMVAL